MMTAEFSYDPSNVNGNTVDRMRFELGDTMVDAGSAACMLSNQEYEAVISECSNKGKSWNHAKLRLLEAICAKLSMQVDTKIDVLSYGFSERAKAWRDMCDKLRKQLTAGAPSVNRDLESGGCFFVDMHNNQRQGV